jgi:hypothetical protein
MENPTRYSYIQWSAKLKKNLEIILTDIKLKNKNYEILFAVDFYDILEYSFPLKNELFFDMSFFNDEKKKEKYIQDQLARFMMFFLLKGLYPHKIILLPPYLREGNDFFIKLYEEMGKYYSNEESLLIIKKLILELSSEFKMAKGDSQCERIVSTLNAKAPELLFISAQSTEKGMNTFKKIMKDRVMLGYSSLNGTDKDMQEELSRNFFAIFEEIQKHGNIDFEEKVQITRNKPERYLQNKRDAEAIRFVTDLTKKLKSNGKIIFLVSSAPHMARLNELYSFVENIDGLNFQLLRGIDHFYQLAIEISRLHDLKDKEFNLDTFDLHALAEVVEADISILSTFLTEDSDLMSMGSFISDDIRRQHLNEVLKLNENINNIDLSFKIEDFMPKDLEDSYACGQSILNEPLIKEFNHILEVIKESLNKGRLLDKISERSMELEKERLDFLWPLGLGNLPFYRKERILETVLFSLPFDIHIEDNETKTMLHEFIGINIKAKNELKKNYIISDEILTELNEELRRLSKQANELKNEEKYTLRMLIFFNMGRHDLVNILYKYIINKLTNERVKEDISYIYIMNFIKIMRKDKLDKSAFKEPMDICNSRSFTHHESVGESLDLSLVDWDLSKLTKDIKINLNRLNNPGYCILNKDTLVIYDNSNDSKLYIFKNYGSKRDLYIYDLRFVHLGSLIFNRFFKDFNEISQEELICRKEKFDTLFIPLVDNIKHKYSIAIYSDYAYLLALNEGDPGYKENLTRVKNLMVGLEESYSESPYWNYVKYYILGYILYKLAEKEPAGAKVYATLAKDYFLKSMKEVMSAPYLRRVLLEFMDKCDAIIKNQS